MVSRDILVVRAGEGGEEARDAAKYARMHVIATAHPIPHPNKDGFGPKCGVPRLRNPGRNDKFVWSWKKEELIKKLERP